MAGSGSGSGSGSSLFAAQEIVNYLIPQVDQQIRLAWVMKDELRRLRESLQTIQALLCDADTRQVNPEIMQLFLGQLTSVARRVDDLLDEFKFEVLRQKSSHVRNRFKNKVRDFCLSNPLLFHLKMAYKVKNINLFLERIRKEANDIGLTPAQLINAAVAPRLFTPTLPFVDDSQVVGRDGDVSTVGDMLLHTDFKHDFSVMAIVGMPGLGKTTLAQLVYNNDKIVRNFGDQRMWVCVSDDFQVGRILNEMVKSLPGDLFVLEDIEGGVRELQERLGGKKYLLVLDGIWNTSLGKWERMINSLLRIDSSKGSKIIVTTRSVEMVSTMQIPPRLTHYLGRLSDDYSWSMFRKRAFADGGPRETPNLVAIGRRMVEKCKGMPSAIKLLGGFMYSKQYEQEWLSIQDGELWGSPEHENGFLPVLSLSFDQLPSPSLKQCFAYCSIIPKDLDIEKDNLIQLWMGQGYLQPSFEMEDVGNDYFDTLLRSSLFQDVKLDEFNNITSCKMHDLVRYLALNVSEGSCLTLTAGEVKDHQKGQHLSMNFGAETSLEIPKEIVGELRTLFLTGSLPKNIADVKRIRALSLKQDGMQELPSSLSKFMHLRYLDLSRTSIETLPNFITKLYNLQTLRLPSPRYLKELPEEFHKLVSLRHFYFGYHVFCGKMQLVPMMVGYMTSLQTLPFFVVGEDSGRRIEELGSLHNLRGKLVIYGLEKVRNREEAELANLSKKSEIHELNLYWSFIREGGINNDENVLEGLKPHRKLKSLKIFHFGGERFASWMMIRMGDDMSLLHNLVTIKLWYCKRCEQIPALGHLPYLKFVEVVGLHNLKYIGPEFYGPSVVGSSSTSGAAGALPIVFPALRKLSLGDMPNLEEWSDESSLPKTTTFFPWLEELTISGCPYLITIPSHLLFQELFIHQPMYDLRNIKRMHGPLLTIVVDPDSKIDVFLEDLLEKSCKSLRTLRILKFNELCHLPNNLQNLTSLENLEIVNCNNLTSIIGLTSPIMANPNGLCSLASLQTLKILACPRLASFWKERLLCLTGLRTLEIGGFSEELEYFPWPSTCAAATAEVMDMNVQHHHHPHKYPFVSLKSLSLWGWPKLKSLPDELRHLTALTDLSIEDFDGLTTIPEWLANLSSLESLWLHDCENLMSLPSLGAMQCLANLESLHIYKCPLLEERCERRSSREWHKIAHIPSINTYHLMPEIGDETFV